MKVLALIEINGDFDEEELSKEVVNDIVKIIINDGAEANCCSGYVTVLEVIEED